MTPQKALQDCITALEESLTYIESPSWSPSMARDCREAITQAKQALDQSVDANKMVQDADQNAPWLTEAHLLCSDHGIPQGNLTERIRALRDKWEQQASEPLSSNHIAQSSELVPLSSGPQSQVQGDSFQEGQWWLSELDAMAKNATPDQKRAVAVVHNLLRVIAAWPQASEPSKDDPLQGAVDWLLQADGEFFCVATVQRTLRIGYNRAKRLADIARERAAAPEATK